MSSVWAQYLGQSQMNISGWEEPCWSLPVALIQFILRIIIDTKLCKGSCITLAPKKLYFSKESIFQNEINKTEHCIDRLLHHRRSSLGVLYPFWSLMLIFFHLTKKIILITLSSICCSDFIYLTESCVLTQNRSLKLNSKLVLPLYSENLK